mmetsp:Transcript_78690/g.172499  ORF Transcript_78690/g.172499 Transcript_78690/m.172499 type:complete len:719 (-) Transcript_78690:323-2479(-)
MAAAQLLWKEQGTPDPLPAIEFARLMASGELSVGAFLHYESQDSEYLRNYIGCWGCMLIKLDPTSEHFTQSAQLLFDLQRFTIGERKVVDDQPTLEATSKALSQDGKSAAEEVPKHQKGDGDDDAESPLLKALEGVQPSCFYEYIQYLQGMSLCRTSNCLELCVAVLPCLRLYAEVGLALKKSLTQEQLDSLPASFKTWICTYACPEFQLNADRTEAMMDRLLDERVKSSKNVAITSTQPDDSALRLQILRGELSRIYAYTMQLELEIFDYYTELSKAIKKKATTFQWQSPFRPGANTATVEPRMYPQALTIAGSDSGGGAGIPADMKAMEFFRVFSSVAITATTAQNTVGVQDVHILPEDHLKAQILLNFDDYKGNLRVVKTGMLPNRAQIEIIADCLSSHAKKIGKEVSLILDPVMIASTGSRLVDDAAVEALKSKLIPMATLLTPNLPEAAFLLGKKESEVESSLDESAKQFFTDYPTLKAVLLKGGHIENETALAQLLEGFYAGSSAPTASAGKSVVDTLFINLSALGSAPDLPQLCGVHMGWASGQSADMRVRMQHLAGDHLVKVSIVHPRIQLANGRLNDHGSGCSLASAVAAGLAARMAPKGPAGSTPPSGPMEYGYACGAAAAPGATRKGYGGCNYGGELSRFLWAEPEKKDEAGAPAPAWESLKMLTEAVFDAVHFVSSAMEASGHFHIGDGHGPLLHRAAEKSIVDAQ